MDENSDSNKYFLEILWTLVQTFLELISRFIG